VQSVNGRAGKAAYHVTGNILWLRQPAKGRDLRGIDPIAALKQSVARLVGEMERSASLKADIAAAMDTRRYELYRHSAALGTRASDRGLAGAQRVHVGSLLKYVRAMAAAGSVDRAQERAPAARLGPLAQSIRALEASLERARWLSADMVTQCQGRDWR
jgi:hypothetical protein